MNFKSRTPKENIIEREFSDGSFEVQLYDTVILERDVDRWYLLNAGNWRTKYTKDTINQYMPYGWRLVQRNFDWYIVPDGMPERDIVRDGIAFFNGVEFHPEKGVMYVEASPVFRGRVQR